MKTTTKIVSLGLCASILFGMAGCSLFDKSADEITEVAETYMGYIQSKKYSKAASSVKDGVDGFSEAELDDDHQDVLDALVATTEYEISDSEGKKGESGSCTITITVADLESCAENAESSSAEDIIAALEDADTIEEEISVKFVSVDDEWVIKDASDIVDFYIDKVEALEFRALTEEDALEYMDSLCQQGRTDLNVAIQLWSANNGDTTIDSLIDEYSYPDNAITLIETVYAGITYDLSVDSSTNESVDITCTYSYKDVSGAVTQTDVENCLIGVAAYYMFQNVDGAEQIVTDTYETLFNSIMAALPSSTAMIDGTATYRVTVDEATGEYNYEVLSVSTSDGIDVDFSDVEYSFEDYIIPALDIALSYGVCTQEEYNEIIASAQGASGSIEQIYEGPDFYIISWYTNSDFTETVTGYTTENTRIAFIIRTMAYYEVGATMTCEVSYNGETIHTSTYVNDESYNDTAYFSFGPSEGTLAAGIYILTITGYDGNELAEFAVTVTE